MRDFVTYTITDEMPPRMGQQIEIPEFMLSQEAPEVNPTDFVLIFIRAIQMVSFLLFTYSFLAIDRFPVLAWVGMPVSLIVFAIFSKWGDNRAVD